ncbi:putative extracellular polygalacturonase [Zopfochytrium polystomum]|nr:putative extracellular polygalacturonase [Zopfochytrium polystomum]
MHALSTLVPLGTLLLALLAPATTPPPRRSRRQRRRRNARSPGPFTVPADTKIDMSGLKAGTTVTVTGTVTWAKGTKYTKSDFLFTLGGSGITFDGTWRDFPRQRPAPKFFKVLTTGKSTIKGITMKNSPIHCFSIGGSDTTFDHVTVDNADGDTLSGGKKLGHNTDAFDVSATGITIQNSNVHNQDDCLAINSGSTIKFLSNNCAGGHGISIGSIDSGKTVDGVTVSGCTISNSENGVRIKTISGATGGSVKNVAYTDITLSNISKYGIVIEQDYLNGGPTGTPTAGIPISGVTLTNVHGTMASGATHSTYILCAACSGFSFSQINITPKNPSCTGVSTSLAGCS